MLLNHCTGSGCHGLQSESGLRLLRVPTSKLATRRITQRNLYSVLQYVDRDNPAASRLLSAAAKPHGTLKNPVFNEHQASQFQRLADWANEVAGRVAADEPATLMPAESEEPSGDARPSSNRSAARPDKPADTPRRNTGRSSAARLRQPRTNRERTARPASDSPADPFDPDVFNRQNSAEDKRPH